MPRPSSSEEWMRSLGHRLRECRGTHPARETAQLLGVTVQAYTAWERGRSEPPCSALAAIARKHGVSADWLLGLPIAGLTDGVGEKGTRSRAEIAAIVNRLVEALCRS